MKSRLLFRARRPGADAVVHLPDSAIPNRFPVELLDHHGQVSLERGCRLWSASTLPKLTKILGFLIRYCYCLIIKIPVQDVLSASCPRGSFSNGLGNPRAVGKVQNELLQSILSRLEYAGSSALKRAR
ncbi:MAG: hypothetical protein U1F42_07735 [Candidatus Competibacteraceae bacterium]